MKKSIIFSLLAVLIIPQAAMALSPCFDCVNPIDEIETTYEWQEEGHTVKQFTSSDYIFEMVDEYSWPYSDGVDKVKEWNRLPLIAWRDGLPYVAVLSAYGYIEVFNYLYPQHRWMTSDQPYFEVYEDWLVVQSAENEARWHLFSATGSEAPLFLDFDQIDVDYNDPEIGFKFEPIQLTNGTLLFKHRSIYEEDSEVIWYSGGTVQVFPDLSVVNQDYWPENRVPMSGYYPKDVPYLYNSDENDHQIVGMVDTGVYTYQKSSGVLSRVGYSSSSTYHTRPRALGESFIAWKGLDSNIYVAEVNLQNPPNTNLVDVPKWTAFKTADSNVVYKNEAYHVNGDSRHEFIKFCSARAYELATQSADFEDVVTVPDTLEFDHDAPCGGIPHYRPFKMASSPTVYHDGRTGLVSYCSAESYQAEHRDPDFYWVVEFADGEIEFEKPNECQ